MTVLKKTLSLIEKGRSGVVQSIPTKVQKYDEFLDGTTQSTMYLYGAETSVGKTVFVRDKHIYTPYEEFKRINDPNKLDILIADFSLEMSPAINMASAMTRKFWQDYQRVVPVKSILRNLSDENNRIIQEVFIPYFEDFEKKLLVFDEDITPTKFHDILMQIAKTYGTFSKEGRWISECGDWTPNNPNLYIEIIIDTVNLAEVDSGHDTVKSTIDRISRLCVWFRNKCGFIPIIIQQFNAEISAVDRSRYGIKTPLLRDFEDSKRPVKDADVVIGLYDPSRHMKEEESIFRGYDITRLRSWFRSLHVMKNRRGENNKFIPLKFDGALGMFSQLPDASAMTPELYDLATRH